MQRDNIDFGKMSIGRLFIKQFVPTLLGMVATAMFIVVDGIFVGRGIGSDALAAVNISTPLANLCAGIGLMFGMGGSILASINVSRGKTKVANINITQSFVLATIVSILIALFVIIFPEVSAKLLGADEDILLAAMEYMFCFVLFLPFFILSLVLPFFVRLTKPKYSMWCLLTATLINIVLDYIFIFEFAWGLSGAALATGIGEAVGVIMLAICLFKKKQVLHFTRLKMSVKSIRLTLRNCNYMMKLGFSSFLSEASLAIMAISGNFVFMKYLGTDGVAAFSIVCYLFPIVFLLFNATVQSVQPIISFNYGCGRLDRSIKALKTALCAAGAIGIAITLIFIFNANQVISLFIADSTSKTFKYASEGLPLFALDFLFFAINIVSIGYYTSIEKIKLAGTLTLLRSLLAVVFFFSIPLWFSVKEIWLAVFLGDLMISFFILSLVLKNKWSKKS